MILKQAHTTNTDNKNITYQHPITCVSGLFQSNQLNWTAVMRGGYAVHMAVKKISCYLADTDIVLCSDHLPLKKIPTQDYIQCKS